MQSIAARTKIRLDRCPSCGMPMIDDYCECNDYDICDCDCGGKNLCDDCNQYRPGRLWSQKEWTVGTPNATCPFNKYCDTYLTLEPELRRALREPHDVDLEYQIKYTTYCGHCEDRR